MNRKYDLSKNPNIISNVRNLLIKIVLGVLFFVPHLSFSQKTPSYQNLQKILEELEKDTLLQNGYLGFCLKNASTGQVVFEKNSKKTMLVASCMKLFSTATALEILGRNFTFKTQLAYKGTIENGVLKGDLYIVGGGDPTLGSPDFPNQPNINQVFANWLGSLQKLGIKEIQGKIVGNGSYFSQNATPAGWIWEDMGNYYGSAVYGLNIHDNEYKLLLQPSKIIGENAKVLGTDPALPFLNFKGNIRTAAKGTGDNAYIDGYAMHNDRFLSGTIPQTDSFFIKGALPNPAFTTAYLFHQYLQQKNLKITQEPSFSYETMPDSSRVIVENTSPTLTEIIREINLYSINLYAESLFKQLGKSKNNEKEAGTIIQHYWKDKGMDITGLEIGDGSGLSMKNGVSAYHLAELLSLMSKSSSYDIFYQSLPIAGISGTMGNWLKNTTLQGNLRAKTGSMKGVIAIAGYFTNAQGEKMCFSIIANRYQGTYSQMRKKFEKVFLAMQKP
jgi:D-alanyl-D-alanine carboxypeptidase/D-alanyl-D-alanine-endopeptidase (penicillin-binding protein 4)